MLSERRNCVLASGTFNNAYFDRVSLTLSPIYPVADGYGLAHIAPAAAEVSMIPQSFVKLSGKEANQMMRLMEELEDHEDVQHVYANFDIEEAELHALTQAK